MHLSPNDGVIVLFWPGAAQDTILCEASLLRNQVVSGPLPERIEIILADGTTRTYTEKK